MLRTIQYTLLSLILLFGASSCLEKYPDSAIPEKEAMKSLSDAEQVLTGVYTTLKSGALQSGYLTLLPDIQTDLVHAVKGNTNVHGSFWLWDIRSTAPEIKAVYESLYTVIGNCNFYLDQEDVVRKNLINDSDFDELDMYTGEIYFIRAWAYSELLKCFCKAYPDNDEKAKGELGVVLATSYFNRPVARRASLYDSYQLVVDDLNRASELLSTDNDSPNSVTASAASVQALQARTALYMQKWDDAITYSSMLIDREKNAVFSLADVRTLSSATGTDVYATMWMLDQSPEVIFRVGFTNTSYGGRLGSVFLNITKDYANFYPDYVPSQWTLALYIANDMRPRAFFQDAVTGYQHGLKWPLLIKYLGNRTFIQNYNLFEVSMPKPFRLSEQYLIRAEAYCRNKDYNKATKDLNTMRRYRFKTGGTINIDEKSWLDVISDERVRELYMEGFRLQDLKRWGRGFERKAQSEAQAEGEKLKIEPNNPLFVWPIPQHELEAPGSEVLPNESNQ